MRGVFYFYTMQSFLKIVLSELKKNKVKNASLNARRFLFLYNAELPTNCPFRIKKK